VFLRFGFEFLLLLPCHELLMLWHYSDFYNNFKYSWLLATITSIQTALLMRRHTVTNFFNMQTCRSHFIHCLSTLMASISSDSSDDDILYATSRCRKLLVADIKAGKHQGMQQKELWLSRPQYQQGKQTLFHSRFYSLQSTTEASTERKERDEKAFVEDTKLGIRTKCLSYSLKEMTLKSFWRRTSMKVYTKPCCLERSISLIREPTHHGLWTFFAIILIKSYEIRSKDHIGLASAKRK
jgi:hypothetical protein